MWLLSFFLMSSYLLKSSLTGALMNDINLEQSCPSIKDIEQHHLWNDWQNFFTPTSWHPNYWHFPRPHFNFQTPEILSNWKPAEWNFHTPMNIKETEKSYEVCMDFPGMTKENISVSVKNGAMVISGNRSPPSESKEGEKYHRVEIPYGHTSKSFTLPSNAKQNEVKATYTNGVLHLTIPKSDTTSQENMKVDVL